MSRFINQFSVYVFSKGGNVVSLPSLFGDGGENDSMPTIRSHSSLGGEKTLPPSVFCPRLRDWLF